MFRRAEDLDAPRIDDPERLAAVHAIDEDAAAQSITLERITHLIAELADCPFAQVSLVGATQFVPSSVGVLYEPAQQHTAACDSLCTVTVGLDRPLVVEDALNDRRVSPLPPVSSGQVGAYLGAPIHSAAGIPVGALCVFDNRPRSWPPALMRQLTACADIVSEHLTTLLRTAQHVSDAERLRTAIRSIVRIERTTNMSGWDIAVRYVTHANGPAGGDFVDLVELSQGRHGIAIGDVAGHGVEAVATMTAVRHALRAYMVDSPVTAVALERTDELIRTTHPGSLTTALQAIYEPATGIVSFSTAGHPPPIHVSAQATQALWSTPRPPLGVQSERRAETTSIRLAEGDSIVLVTDGVFERRGEDFDQSISKLEAALARHAHRSLDDYADAVVADMIPGEPDDDACMLILRHQPTAPQPPQAK